MSIIKTLTNLLTRAYRREAAALDVKANKLFGSSVVSAEHAVELAAQAQAEQNQATELRAQSIAVSNQADSLRKRGEEVAAFFSAEVK